MSKKPAQFLQDIIGKEVLVKLNSGVEYRGRMACLDGFMNIALESTQEFVEGIQTNEYGDCFIRGNNGKRFHLIVIVLLVSALTMV